MTWNFIEGTGSLMNGACPEEEPVDKTRSLGHQPCAQTRDFYRQGLWESSSRVDSGMASRAWTGEPRWTETGRSFLGWSPGTPCGQEEGRREREQSEAGLDTGVEETAAPF